MKIVVAVKRVVDPNIHVRPRADGADVDIVGVKMVINPFDEIAVEEALRLREAGIASEVVAVAVGTTQSQEVLRHTLAMGVDRALLIETETMPQSLATAKLLRVVVEREQPRLILIGKQAIDDDAAEVGQMLAALLNVGQGTFASRLELTSEQVVVTREIEGGQQQVLLPLPAVVTTDLRLNEPRYVKLPNLMMAKKKPIEVLKAADLNVDIAPRLTLLQVAEPAVRAPGIKVSSVQELIIKLREQTKVVS